MNNQAPEKKSYRDDGFLEVHSIFHTIQGEGPFCGSPAVFVRLAGCNLQCPGCDTEYTAKRKLLSADQILINVRHFAGKGLVVITGGEPFRQDLTVLLYALVDAGYYVQIETNGTLPPSQFSYSHFPDLRSGAYIVCSPKTGKINPEILGVACALKYVASDLLMPDGLPVYALDHTAKPYLARPPKGWKYPIYLQPEDAKNPEQNQRNQRAAVRSCMEHGYTLQLQIHKIIGVE